MLQKVDKDRLDKVLEVLKKAGVRHPNATITRELGFDNGMVSNYLNGKKPISDKFYTTIIQHFEKEENTEKPPIENKVAENEKPLMFLVTELVQNCTTLCNANNKLADNNTVLTGLVKSLCDKSNLTVQGQQVPISDFLHPALERIARHIVEQKIFDNFDDAMRMIGKALVSEVPESAL